MRYSNNCALGSLVAVTSPPARELARKSKSMPRPAADGTSDVLLFVAIDLLLRRARGGFGHDGHYQPVSSPPRAASVREHAAMGCVFSGPEMGTP